MKRSSKRSTNPYDAVIFVPSIGNEWTDQSLELIARKMSRALALQEDGRTEYEIDLQDEDNFGGGDETVKFYSVSRSDPNAGTREKFFDLYQMKYRDLLIHNFENRTLLYKSLQVLQAVVNNMGRVFGAFFHSFTLNLRRKPDQLDENKGQEWIKEMRKRNAAGITWVAKLQALYALVIFSMVAAYMILLFLSAFGIIATAAVGVGQQVVNSPSTVNVPQAVEAVVSQPLGGLASLFLAVVTLIAGITPNQMREFILGVIVDYICMVNYLDDDHEEGQKRKLIAQLQTFLDRISSYGNGRYKRYIIISYSFGSIVALDTLFPKEGLKRGAVVNETSMLFTIGSPFDLIRSFWNSYFEKRNVSEFELEWWNIYSRFDLLGSNFRNDDDNKHPDKSYIFSSEKLREIGFKPMNVRYGGDMPIKLSLRFLLLYALRAHSVYWDRETDNSDAFEHVVKNLYPPLPARLPEQKPPKTRVARDTQPSLN